MPINEQIRRILVKKPSLIPPSLSNDKLQSYTCSYCSKLFSSPSHLSRHILIHTGEKPCLCSECGKQFSQISSLERHQHTKHEKEKKFNSLNSHLYQCKLCHEYFSLKHNLKMHEKKLHEKQTNFFCNICSAYFTCNSSLQKHRNFRHRSLIKNQQLTNSNQEINNNTSDNWTLTSTTNLFHLPPISNSSINNNDHSYQQQVHYQILKCNEIN